MTEMKPSATWSPDQCAAHEFLSELRTRISTQPLPYQYGTEARALESLWEVFAQARAAMRANPGCIEFSNAVTRFSRCRRFHMQAETCTDDLVQLCFFFGDP